MLGAINFDLERDIIKCLKEIGYLGPGLKKENISILCHGEMLSVWDHIIQRCRSKEKASAIRERVNADAQNQAVIKLKNIEHELDSEMEIRRLRIKNNVIDKEIENNIRELNEIQEEIEDTTRKMHIRSRDKKYKESNYIEKCSKTTLLNTYNKKLKGAEEGISREVSGINEKIEFMKQQCKIYEMMMMSDSDGIVLDGPSHFKLQQDFEEILSMQFLSDVDKFENDLLFKNTKSEELAKIVKFWNTNSGSLEYLLYGNIQNSISELQNISKQFKNEFEVVSEKKSTSSIERLLEKHHKDHIKEFLFTQKILKEVESLKDLEKTSVQIIENKKYISNIKSSEELYQNLIEIQNIESEIKILKIELQNIQVKLNSNIKEKQISSESQKIKNLILLSKTINEDIIKTLKTIKQQEIELNRYRRESEELCRLVQIKLKGSWHELCKKCGDLLAAESEAMLNMNLKRKEKKLCFYKKIKNECTLNVPNTIQRLDWTSDAHDTIKNPNIWTTCLSKLMNHLNKENNMTELNDPMNFFNIIYNDIIQLEENVIKRNILMKETNKLDGDLQSMSNQSKNLNEKYEEREKWIDSALIRAENILINSQKFITKLNTDIMLILNDYKKLPAFECIKNLMHE